MSEMHTPLQWADRKERKGERETAEGFSWPTPPFAAYSAATPFAAALDCEIVGLNDKVLRGRLMAFTAEQAEVQVQLPPSKSSLPLRFDQFKSLTLVAPLRREGRIDDDPDALALAPRHPSAFQLTWKQGSEWQGTSFGSVQESCGLFLFPPSGDVGAVTRVFVPRHAIGSFQIDSGPVTANAPAPAVARTSRLISTPERLRAALDEQARMPMVRIGDALLALGLIDQAQLDAALTTQSGDTSAPLGEILVRSGVISRPELQVAMARKMGFPLVDVDAFPIEAEALRRLPFALGTRLGVLPLMLCDGRLVVALDDPARRRAAVEEIEFSAQMKATPVLAQTRSMEQRMFAVYEQIGAVDAGRAQGWAGSGDELLASYDTDSLVESLERDNDSASGDDKPIEQSDNSLVRLINNMIIEAHREGASDIHIESYPGREKIRIRFRKDGQLRTYLELPPNYRASLIGRIKVMCDLDISEKRKPQDGKINFARFSPQHRIELRVATIPTNNGLEDVVMRILVSARPLPIDQLGMSPHNLEQLKLAISRPYGMVLCVGPTGSGKTTTLHSALASINEPHRKIWTAEDPIEITQQGLRQVQVNPRIDWTFAKALRSFLRADPDVIMVGEIRDAETAQMAIEASLTGHLVMSTLHTNSAPETVTRLLDMGMDPFNFADSLLAVLAQRLVRRLCTQCKSHRAATDDEINGLLDEYLYAFGADIDTGTAAPDRDSVQAEWTARHAKDGCLVMHRATGCPSCDGTGYKGRAGIHELMVVSREVRRLVQTGARAEALQACALKGGMRTLRQDGLDKVLAGVTTIEEVRATSNQ
jgi:type II secretory ATPase GspE/PulE/Tfp pilus assembly ATPase PilB-like protein